MKSWDPHKGEKPGKSAPAFGKGKPPKAADLKNQAKSPKAHDRAEKKETKAEERAARNSPGFGKRR